VGKQKKKKHQGRQGAPTDQRSGKATTGSGFQPLRNEDRLDSGLKSLLRDRVTLKIYTDDPLPGLQAMEDKPFTGPAPQNGLRLCKEYANMTPAGLIEELAAKGLFYIGGNFKRNEQGTANYLKFARENGRPLQMKLVSTILRTALENIQLHKFEVFAKPYQGTGRIDLVKLYAGDPEPGDRPHRIIVSKKSWAIEPIVA